LISARVEESGMPQPGGGKYRGRMNPRREPYKRQGPPILKNNKKEGRRISEEKDMGKKGARGGSK